MTNVCHWVSIGVRGETRYYKPTCQAALSEHIHRVGQWAFCPYCGKALKLEEQ